MGWLTHPVHADDEITGIGTSRPQELYMYGKGIHATIMFRMRGQSRKLIETVHNGKMVLAI